MLALKRGDIPLVNSNPDPKAEYLKENIVTEANVTYLSTADNNVAMPVSVRYKPKAGKSGEEMKQREADKLIQDLLPGSERRGTGRFM